MVLVLDGNLEIDANVETEICDFACSRHFSTSTAVVNLKLFSFARAQRVLSFHPIHKSTMSSAYLSLQTLLCPDSSALKAHGILYIRW